MKGSPNEKKKSHDQIFKCAVNWLSNLPKYITEVFHNNNPASLFRPIPITKQEATRNEATNDFNCLIDVRM